MLAFRSIFKKGDAFSSLLFKFILDYDFRCFKVSRDGFEIKFYT